MHITQEIEGKPKSMIEAASFRDPEIIVRFSQRHGVSIADAEHLWSETLKFLTTGVIMGEAISPSGKLDEMWHHFILHTRAYGTWCTTYFGRMIHHNPTETPVVENRSKLLTRAREIWGDIDESLWPQEGVTACDSSCSGDSYCTES